MNRFNRCFVFLQLLVQILMVASYTTVLKQVKPFYPPVKVYRYELRHAKVLPEGKSHYIYSKPSLGQRIFPVVVNSGRDVPFRTRVPLKKEKGKLYKVGSTTEKPVLRDPQLLGLAQHLVPPVSNQVEEYSEAKEEEVREVENDIRPLLNPFQSLKSFSSFGQDKGRVYNNPGEWATPVPQANSVAENASKTEFTPSQLYLQIRHKNTVIHVPQSEALNDAETLEELINAPRLKELSKTTHVQETYSEEGYEDAGYDHAGHIRQAQHGEVYDAKDEGKFKIKEAPIILDYDSDLEESKKLPLKKENPSVVPAEGNLNNKLEPRITRSRSEMSKTFMEYSSRTPTHYKGEHKYSSRIKTPIKASDEKESQMNLIKMNEFPTTQATFPSYFGEMPPAPESITANDSEISYVIPMKISSKYRKGDFNSTKIYPVSESTPLDVISPVNEYTDFKPYISMIDSQASPSAKSLKYSRIYSKKTKQLRLEPYKNENIYSPSPSNSELPSLNEPKHFHPQEEPVNEEPVNERIVLPTIGYINSLTTAHFGKGNLKSGHEESKSQLTGPLNLTQALNYLRSNKKQQNLEVTRSPTEIDIRTFEPMKLSKTRPDTRAFINKSKRDVYLMRSREKRSGTDQEEEYEGNDESDLPHNEKNTEIDESERKRIEEENQEKKKYEEDLKSEISKQEKKIIKETFKNIGVEEDISEAFPEFPSSDSDSDFPSFPLETTPTSVNIRKYPFYMSKKLPENSALRYATDPKQFPKKSGYKMEFYESREQVIQCPDFHPDLKDLPDSNSTEYSENQAGENQRLGNLGDKIACLRMKYFDPEPFDNPIFQETEINYVGKPVKGRNKVKTKVKQKTSRVNKEDQTLKQASHQKSYQDKLENQKGINNKTVKGANFNQPPQSGRFVQGTTFQEVKSQPAEPSKVIAHSKLHLKGNKVGKIQTAKGQVNNKLSVPKIFRNISVSSPLSGWVTVQQAQSLQQRPHSASKPEIKHHIINSSSYLPHASQFILLGGTKKVTSDCNDGIPIQKVVASVPCARMVPKENPKIKKVVKVKWNKKIPSQPSTDQTDWVPIAGYILPNHFNRSEEPLSRRTDQVTRLRNEINQNNSSAHYVIDELKEDENVRKGEVVEDMGHYLKLMEDFKHDIKEETTVETESKAENSTRKRRQTQSALVKPKKQSNFSKILEFSFDKALIAQNLSKTETDKPLDEPNASNFRPFELKRPLKRLSGLDFLVRYHKIKGKPTTQKPEDFWKVTTPGPTTSKNVHNSQRKSGGIVTRTTFKSITDKLDKTTSVLYEETTTKESEIKEISESRKRQTKSPNEKFNKHKAQKMNESRKFSNSNLISEKITKKPENKLSEHKNEIFKTVTQNSVTEKIKTKPANLIKIVTKISTKTTESSEKPQIIYKKANSNSNYYNSSTDNPKTRTPLPKPELLQYKSINRSSTSFQNKGSAPLSRSTENPDGPILYYVVNLKTGRGKWITNYEEKIGSLRKHWKPQTTKEISGTKKDKRRKKSEN